MPYKDPEAKRKWGREYARSHPKQQAAYREKHLPERSSYNAEYHKARKAAISAIKAVPCMDCGVVFPPCCMDFDHRNPEGKSFGIASNTKKNWDEVLQEIAKCDIVCANCHRIRHYEEEG